MPTCPQGHDSAADDFCDQCGSPMPAAPAAQAKPASAPAAQAQPAPLPEPETCPHCGAPRPKGALFCEACGYDYTTGALPEADLATALGLSEATPAPRAEPEAAPEGLMDELEPVPATAAAPAEPADALPGVPSPAPAAPLSPRPPAAAQTWVAEVWTDPDWYALQEATDPMPPAGPPAIFPLRDTSLVGRYSASRGIDPEVDCGQDSGCSRRQAELTRIGTQWYIADLDSANGTFTAPAGAALPTTPIKGRVAVGQDDRIYVGAWTRIVVRPAAEGEAEALG